MDGVFGEQISTVFEAIAMTDADEEIWEVLKQRKHELPYDPYMHELPIVPSCNVPKVHVEAIKVLGSVTLHFFLWRFQGQPEGVASCSVTG